MQKIDKNIPVPDRSRYEVLDKMQVGDSTLFTNTYSAKLSVPIRNRKPKQFTRRKEAEGSIRVWRTK
jgi:hypothetical protein